MFGEKNGSLIGIKLNTVPRSVLDDLLFSLTIIVKNVHIYSAELSLLAERLKNPAKATLQPSL